jgi:hypothetical protein
MSIIKLLRHSNWVAVNKDLVKLVGCNAAYLLGYLADKHDYFASRDGLTKDGYFFATCEDVECDLGLSRREQDTAIKSLVSAKLLGVALKGVPAKRFFLFDEASENALYSLLVEPNKIGGMRQTRLAECAKLDCTNAPNKNGGNAQTIYKDLNNISNNEKGVVGEFHSPDAPQKTGDEKAEFSEWLHNNGFIRLSKTNFFLEKEKSCAKKEKHGEAGYLQALADIEKHLADDPKYIAKRKDFSRVFDTFAKSTELLAAKSNLNRVFSAKFGTDYTTDTKAAETALNGVISKLQVYNGNLKITETIAKFFDALATLPKFDNPTAWKPAFINADFSEIIALLKNNKAQPSRGETYKERDARLAQEKRDAEKAALKESAAYDAMRAQIIRILDNGGELQPFHKESQPYKDMFDGDQTPF